MPDKPQKFGFLEYALCTMNGYFLCVVAHHVPGKQKRKQRGLDETNLDEESLLQLRSQKRYGVQGALVMRLVGMLNNHGHHIVGDQGLRDRRAFVDHIKSHGWNRKWGMHAIQQKRHQGYLCWADLHELETSFEEECKKYTGKNIPSGNGRTKWSYYLGLIKLILKYNKRNKR